MKRLHIAVGVVSDAAGRILISERKADCAYAGQWEFPGGKLEADESVEQALRRELFEELGLEIRSARPLIRLQYDYPDRQVLLDTWRVTDWSGTAVAREGQRFEWVEPRRLDHYPMLVANRPIVRAVHLPDRYLITPDPAEVRGDFQDFLERSLRTHASKLVRLRAWSLCDADYRALARSCLTLCRAHGAQLLLDRMPELVSALAADGWHASARQLDALTTRPLPDDLLFAVSCHTRSELRRAHGVRADFAVLGPVLETPSHAGQAALGWEGFRAAAEDAGFPVYALGGMTLDHLPQSWQAGAQGIAAIRGLWVSA